MIDKVQKLMEELGNEFENLKSLMITLNAQSEDNKNQTTELTIRENKVTDKEIKVLTLTKENEETKKNLTLIAGQVEAKQSKLQDEWDRMLKEKEEWTGFKESLVKERARLENLESELKKVKDELFEKSSIEDKKAESVRDMAKMLKSKEEKLNQSQSKVDKYLNSL